MADFQTTAIHGDPGVPFPAGSLRPPLYDTAAFEFESSRDIELAFSGKKAAHAYTRITNPTVAELERRIALLSGARGVVAVSSGMAAITNTVMAIAGTGTTVVTSRHLFSHTISLFEETLGRWGLHIRYVDMNSPDSLADALDSSVRLVFLESITNPQLEVADIASICSVAAKAHVPVVLDGTLTTLCLFDSQAAGVAVEILSSTKYISGGATGVGGLIIDNGTFNWSANPSLQDLAGRVGPAAFLMRLRRETFRNTGACMSPHNAWHQLLGLETMELRVRAGSANALAVAHYLVGCPEVLTVNYPGLPASPYHAPAARQFKGAFGGILTFDLRDRRACFAFMDALKLVRRATNLNDNKSLIIHPASTIFADFSATRREHMGVADTMLRLSTGIESVSDIIQDLKRGLEAI